MAPEGGIAAVVSHLHISVEAPGCAGHWFSTAESSLRWRARRDHPGQEVTNFPPPFPQPVFYVLFFPISGNFLTIWGEAAVRRHKGIAVWNGEWVQGEGDSKLSTGIDGIVAAGSLPWEKHPCWEESGNGAGREDTSWAAEPQSPFCYLWPRGTCSSSRILQQLSTEGEPPTRHCGKSFAPTVVAALSIWERQKRKRGWPGH